LTLGLRQRPRAGDPNRSPVRGTIEEETLYTLSTSKKFSPPPVLFKRRCEIHCPLADIKEFDRYNAVYKDFFKDVPILPRPHHRPIGPLERHQVEIDVIARKPV